jgi:hypothetical protein
LQSLQAILDLLKTASTTCKIKRGSLMLIDDDNYFQMLELKIGVGEYKLSDLVPQELVDMLPSAKDIKKQIKSKYRIEKK